MGSSGIKLEWVKPPVQARSQQTLERLLDATEAILDERGLEGVTIAEVARRAGSSVGAFYSRFADKDALMRCVLQRFNDQAIATAQAILEPSRWQAIAAADALEMMIQFMLRILRERRALIWALTVGAATDPELVTLGERLHRAITDGMLRLIRERGHCVAHPEPATAVHMAVWLVLSAMEARALHGHQREAALDDATVGRELAQMVIRYVGLGEPTVLPHALRAEAAAKKDKESSIPS
jgi:AcrR family transcriptional regulator